MAECSGSSMSPITGLMLSCNKTVEHKQCQVGAELDFWKENYAAPAYNNLAKHRSTVSQCSGHWLVGYPRFPAWPLGLLSSTWRNTAPPHAAVPRNRTHEDSFIQSLRNIRSSLPCVAGFQSLSLIK